MNKKIVCSAALPPPIHGQSNVNLWVQCKFNEFSLSHVWADTSPKSRNKKNFSYHLRRLNGVLLTLKFIVKNGDQFDRIYYTVFESGFGKIYNFITTILARLAGYRIVIHHHTAHHAKKFSLSFYALARIIGLNGIHVVLTERMAKDINTLYGVKTTVLSNVCTLSAKENFPLHDYSETTKLECSGEFVIGYLSNICKEKGFLLFCGISEKLIESNPAVRIVVAGPIIDNESKIALDHLVAMGGSRVEYRGTIGGDRKIRFFNDLNLLVFPTLYKYEAQPIVILEALQAGVPVLAFSQGYVEDLLPPDWLFKNAEDLLLAVDEITQSKDSSSTYKSLLSQRASEQYSALSKASENQVRKFLEIFGCKKAKNDV